MLADNLGENEPRTMTIVAAAESALDFQQLARFLQCHIITGPQ
jgi:hypothetical protein